MTLPEKVNVGHALPHRLGIQMIIRSQNTIRVTVNILIDEQMNTGKYFLK